MNLYYQQMQARQIQKLMQELKTARKVIAASEHHNCQTGNCDICVALAQYKAKYD